LNKDRDTLRDEVVHNFGDITWGSMVLQPCGGIQ